MERRTSAPLGAILAGGRNSRYGGVKALAPVGGERIIDRVAGALRAVTTDVVLIANDAPAYAEVRLPMRADSVPGVGVLGGILTAVEWAREGGLSGALVVACDMPFASSGLLGRLVELARGEVAGAGGEPPPDVVLPASGGPRGVEPLCAWYSTRCIEAIRAAIERGERAAVSFHDDVRVMVVPEEEVRSYGDPAVLFLNVNTPGERERAERLAGGGDG